MTFQTRKLEMLMKKQDMLAMYGPTFVCSFGDCFFGCSGSVSHDTDHGESNDAATHFPFGPPLTLCTCQMFENKQQEQRAAIFCQNETMSKQKLNKKCQVCDSEDQNSVILRLINLPSHPCCRWKYVGDSTIQSTNSRHPNL
jgi:hypothetical protein